MRFLIAGTAGHIDHGKSALVLALTGIDPDRLKEEKARGITIDLGFADLDLGEGRAVSFVDVPGHERFVRHMVAGASGIDVVLLVVAADAGVQPQTREHLSICALLGVRRGILVLTKCDLVDRELREVVELEVRELVEGTFLAAAPIVSVSSRTGEGLDVLRGLLGDLVDHLPARPASGMARLPIDRAFVLRGFGTVVTGTMSSGTLREGDEVEVFPGGHHGRVRGLQVHGERVASVVAGQRAAVNLQGMDRADAPRGGTLGHPGALPVTRRIWARVRLLDGAPDALRRGGVVRFHQATCERWARLRILGRQEPDELHAEVLLRGDTVLLPGDAFILRRPSPLDTLGGGVVVDIRPPTGRGRASSAAMLGAMAQGSGMLDRVARAGIAGRPITQLAAELGLDGAQLQAASAALEDSGDLLRVLDHLVHVLAWERLGAACGAELDSFHEREPLRAGMSREDLRARVAREMPQELWRAFLEREQARGSIRLDGERVARAGHEVRLSEGDRTAASRIEKRFLDAALDPPDAAAVLAAEGGARAARIVDLLVAQGRLVRIRDGRLFHEAPLAQLRAKLRDHARTCALIDVTQFKQLAGVTRKNAIPLLEQLDAERVTRRVGNSREILVREPAGD